jgi:cell division septation protein DedD
MKTLLAFLVSFITSSFVAYTPAMAHTAEVGIGDVAPDIVLPNPNGVNASLSSLSGNVVLVYFWVSWDPGSRKNNAELENLYKKYHTALFPGAKGFEIFTVSLDYENQEWIAALRNDRLPGAYHTNDFYSKYAGIYGIDKLPAMFIIDENGVVQSNNPDLTQIDQWLTERSGGGAAQSVLTIPSVAPDTWTPGKEEEVYTPPVEKPAPTSTTKAVAPPSTKPKPAVTTPNATDVLIPDVAVAPTTSGKNYRVQVGAFKSIVSARTEALSQFGQVSTETAGDFKRVLVGSCAKLSEVKELQKQLQKAGYPDAIVVQYDGTKRVKVLTKADLEKAETALPAVPIKNAMGGKTSTAQTNARKITNASSTTANVEWQKMPDPTATPKTAKVTPKTTTQASKAKTTKVAAVEEPVVDNLTSIQIDAKDIGVLKQKKAGQKVAANVAIKPYPTAKADETLMAEFRPPITTEQAGFTWSETAKVTTKGNATKPAFTPPNATAKNTQTAATEQTMSDPNFSESYTKSSSTVTFTSPTIATTTTNTLSQDRPTYYDFHDPYISAAYTKPNDPNNNTTTYKSGTTTTTTTVTKTTTAVPTTTTPTVVSAPVAAPIERQKATPINATAPTANTPAVATTPATTSTPPDRQKATPINATIPTANTTPNVATSTNAKTEATNKIDNIDQYLDSYDYSNASSSKSKILKNKEKRNKKKKD